LIDLRSTPPPCPEGWASSVREIAARLGVPRREKGAEAPSDSEKSFLGEAQSFAASNNQMIEHPNFDELQCIAQPASD
jgi:hypothetical protein